MIYAELWRRDVRFIVIIPDSQDERKIRHRTREAATGSCQNIGQKSNSGTTVPRATQAQEGRRESHRVGENDAERKMGKQRKASSR
jgi:hypothetical protein